MVTRENINSCLSQIENEQQKTDFIRTMLKLDIIVGLIKGEEESYYKIWIIRKDTNKKVCITDYYHKKGDTIASPLLEDVLYTIREIADVPDTFEEYCEWWIPEPHIEDYEYDLRRARRFKRILDLDEIRSIPYLLSKNSKHVKNFEPIDSDSLKEIHDGLIKRHEKLGFTIIRLRNMSEYVRLQDLINTAKYMDRLLTHYGFDKKTGEFDVNLFPVPKTDKELDEMKRDTETFNKEIDHTYVYLKHLAMKYLRKTAKLSEKGVVVTPPERRRYAEEIVPPIIIKFQ